MSDDTWWAFIAGINKQALLRELPGSRTTAGCVSSTLSAPLACVPLRQRCRQCRTSSRLSGGRSS